MTSKYRESDSKAAKSALNRFLCPISRVSRYKMASTTDQYGWTDEDVDKLIRLRAEKDYMFSGKRNAARLGWEMILKEMGLADKVSTTRARKKWKNLTKKFKELKQSPSGVVTKSKDTVPRNWKWFELMNEAIGWKLSLISSASPNYSSTELLETDESDPGFSPLPPKRQHKDPVLEFLEREAERSEARERRAEEREEKLLNLLERIVDKM